MDDKDQAEGEKRVRKHLVEPLLKVGLVRPAGLTREGFDDMLTGLCQRLAYMTSDDLDVLAEIVLSNPAGKAKDRWPAGPWILDRAREVAPPEPGASPLIRRVFAHALGQRAVREGFGPDLLTWLRRARRFPTPEMITFLERETRSLREREGALRRRAALSEDDARWLAARRDAHEMCKALAGVSQ
jgi:hypothetical protein